MLGLLKQLTGYSTSDDDESLLATGTINSTITQRLRNASCLSVVSVNSTVP